MQDVKATLREAVETAYVDLAGVLAEQRPDGEDLQYAFRRLWYLTYNPEMFIEDDLRAVEEWLADPSPSVEKGIDLVKMFIAALRQFERV